MADRSPDRRRPPGLGPHLVGTRVVVRRLLRGEVGPSGGPAMTDLLGVMESWGDGVTRVRDESGAVTEIEIDDIVTGKPVPPRPSVRLRVTPEEAERRAVAGWPAPESEPLGEWLLRAADGFSSRANSVLAVGDPGLPVEEALERVRDFYERHGLPALAQVIVGGVEHHAVEDAGWVPARPGEDDTMFQIGSVTRVLRATRRAGGGPAEVSLASHVDEAWLRSDERARSHGQAAVRVLEGPGEVVLATVAGEAGVVAARGRAAYDDGWVGISDLVVDPAYRRRGLARTVLAELLEWGAERGAATAYLQVRGDNPAALALYEGVGFLPHHTYRYLTPPR